MAARIPRLGSRNANGPSQAWHATLAFCPVLSIQAGSSTPLLTPCSACASTCHPLAAYYVVVGPNPDA